MLQKSKDPPDASKVTVQEKEPEHLPASHARTRGSAQSSPTKKSKKGGKDVDAAPTDDDNVDPVQTLPPNTTPTPDSDDNDTPLAKKGKANADAIQRAKERLERNEAEWEKEKDALQAKHNDGTIPAGTLDPSTLAIAPKRMGIFDFICDFHRRQLQCSLDQYHSQAEISREVCCITTEVGTSLGKFQWERFEALLDSLASVSDEIADLNTAVKAIKGNVASLMKRPRSEPQADTGEPQAGAGGGGPQLTG